VRSAWKSIGQARIISPSNLRTAGKNYASKEEYMENNGTSLQSLAERIRAKTEQDAQEIESLTRQQFENLSRNLSASSKNALNTAEIAIRNSIAELEKNITSNFQSLGSIFSRKYLYSILLSGGIVLATILLCGGMIAVSRQQITGLQQAIAGLKAQKEIWDRDFPLIQRAFSGLELYQSQGKSYLLLPVGRTSRLAGTVEKREAVEIVRK
jgi:hypothetical protein